MAKNPPAARKNHPVDPPADDEVVHYIDEWMRRLNLKNSYVAKKAEVNEGYLSSLRNGGRTNPTNAFLRRIAPVMGIPWKLLLEPPPPAAAVVELAKYGREVIDRLSRVEQGKKRS